jgi:RNA polymerase sigma factor (sigma-70 family)
MEDLSQDRAWLTGYRNGEPAALERVFRAYGPLVFHVLRAGRAGDGRAYLSRAVDEDDVVQDTFIRLFSDATRKRYDGIRPFGALVRVVARSALIDHLRRRDKAALAQGLEDVDLQPQPLDQWTPGTPLPDQLAVTAQEQERARAFVAALPEQDRGLLRLRFEEGLTQDQAAQHLGVSRQNLRTLEAKLRNKIKDFIGSLG